MAQSPDFSWYSMSSAELLKFLDGQTQYITSPNSFPKTNITYSFYTNAVTPPIDTYSFIREVRSGVPEQPKSTPFTPSEQNATKTFFNFISKIVNLNFTESAPGTGDLNLVHVNTSMLGYANYPNTGTSFYITDSEIETSRFLSTLWHEGEHGLGLKHPGNYTPGDETPPFINSESDSELLTNVSYNYLARYVDDVSKGTRIDMNSLSPLDYAALVKMYGLSSDESGINYKFTNNWSDAFTTYDTKTIIFPVTKTDFAWAFGSKGYDTIDLSGYKTSSYIWLDGIRGIVGLDWTPNEKIARYNFLDGNTVPTDLNNIGNVRVYPSDGKNSFGVERIILPDYNNNITMGPFFPEVVAGLGNDAFTGFYSSKLVDGGAGINTWLIDGKFADYKRFSDPSYFTISDKNGEVVNYKNIDKMLFNDLRFITDKVAVSSHMTVYRLYDAAFDRTPDVEGLGFWIAQSDYGMSASKIANSFLESPEFISVYGNNTDDVTFISKLYKNALERNPDQAGLTYWVDQLKSGFSREDTLIQFADSGENKLQINAQTQNGIQYIEWSGLA